MRWLSRFTRDRRRGGGWGNRDEASGVRPVTAPAFTPTMGPFGRGKEIASSWGSFRLISARDPPYQMSLHLIRESHKELPGGCADGRLESLGRS
jgi:hypothetical protein